ncbi:MAG: dihydrofolate reductase [Erysipelotrichaceae bacterium]
MVVAIDQNGLIGSKGKMPWLNKEDLKWFKQITIHKKILMGRVTYENLGKPLMDRELIILSKNEAYEVDQTVGWVCHQPALFLPIWAKQNEPYMLCGGKAIYELGLPYTQEIYLSLMEGTYQGDTYLNLDLSHFKLISSENRTGFQLFHYQRIDK